jgi:hypothetical protein
MKRLYNGVVTFRKRSGLCSCVFDFVGCCDRGLLLVVRLCVGGLLLIGLVLIGVVWVLLIGCLLLVCCLVLSSAGCLL